MLSEAEYFAIDLLEKRLHALELSMPSPAENRGIVKSEVEPFRAKIKALEDQIVGLVNNVGALSNNDKTIDRWQKKLVKDINHIVEKSLNPLVETVVDLKINFEHFEESASARSRIDNRLVDAASASIKASADFLTAHARMFAYAEQRS